MTEPTQNPVLSDNINLPAAGTLRAVVQFPCGCDAFVDIPLEMFAQVEADILEQHGVADPTVAAEYLIGSYSAKLVQGLAAAPHSAAYCPATLMSVILPEESA